MNAYFQSTVTCVILGAVMLFGWPLGPLAQAQSLKDFPQSGMLAAAGNVGNASLTLPLPLGMGPGVQAPITGSVSGFPGGSWSCSVSNNSSETLHIRTEVVEYVKGPKRGGSRPLSFRLKPGQSANEALSAGPGTLGFVLNLQGWRIIDRQ